MAIAFVAQITYGVQAPATTQTYSFASGSCDLILACFWDDEHTTDLISTVTFNGNSMTKITGASGSGNGGFITTWYIFDNSGTHNIVVNSGTALELACVASSYSGTQQSSSVIQASNYTATETLQTTGASTVSTTSVANCWGVAFAYTDGEGIASYAVGTQRTTANLYRAEGDSNGTITASSTYTGTFTRQTNDTKWKVAIVEISPVPPPAANGNFLYFM